MATANEIPKQIATQLPPQFVLWLRQEIRNVVAEINTTNSDVEGLDSTKANKGTGNTGNVLQLNDLGDYDDSGYTVSDLDQTIPVVDDTAYDSTTWNGNLDAASKNAIRDQFVGYFYVANGVTLTTGTTSSVLSDLQTMLDGNTYDIEEDTGADAIDLEVDFTGVNSISSVAVFAYYDGSLTHGIRIQLYNYDTTSWDTIHTFTDALDYEQHFKAVPVDTNYISSTNAIVRLVHTESGNASHDLYVDYVGLKR